MTSVSTRPPLPPPSTSTPVAPPKLRYRSNPLRPVEKPINPASSRSKPSKTTSKPSTLPSQPSPTVSTTTPSAPTPFPPKTGTAGTASAATAATGAAHAADPTTLPRGKVTEVNRRIEDGVHKTTITIALASGEERSLTDSGVESIRVSSDLHVGDACTLHPTGLGTFTWQKDADSTVASSKPRRKRRVFNVDDLIGERGLRALLSTLPRMKWQGYGYEAADLHQLLLLYKVWAKEMYQFDHFQVLMKRMEVMGASSRVQRYMDAFRYPEEEGGGRGEGGDKRMKVGEGTAEKEKRGMDEAAAALMDDVYGEGEGRGVDVLREARVGLGGEYDDALRSIGVLPPLPAAAPVVGEMASDQPVPAAMEEEQRQRMEDSRRRAMERLAAKKRQRQLEQAVEEEAVEGASAAAAVEQSPLHAEREPVVEVVPQPPQSDGVALPLPAIDSPSSESPAEDSVETHGEQAEAPSVVDDPARVDAPDERVDGSQSAAVELSAAEGFVPETLEVALAEAEEEVAAAVDEQHEPPPAVDGVDDVDDVMIPSSLSEADAEA